MHVSWKTASNIKLLIILIIQSSKVRIGEDDWTFAVYILKKEKRDASLPHHLNISRSGGCSTRQTQINHVLRLFSFGKRAKYYLVNKAHNRRLRTCMFLLLVVTVTFMHITSIICVAFVVAKWCGTTIKDLRGIFWNSINETRIL